MVFISSLSLSQECVHCRGFGNGEKPTCEQDCSYLTLIKVKAGDKLPQPTDQSFPLTHCKERDSNDCWFYYTYAIRNDTREVYLLEDLGMKYDLMLRDMNMMEGLQITMHHRICCWRYSAESYRTVKSYIKVNTP